jgi:V/A-type H+-transporting ATPase subunit A
VAEDFNTFRQKLIHILSEEAKLLEIVKLIGSDVLPDDQKLVIEIGRVIRVGFLQQNAFHKDDTYVPLLKQYHMMRVIVFLYEQGLAYVSEKKSIQVLKESSLFENIIQMKYDTTNENMNVFDDYIRIIRDTMRNID